MSSVDPVPRSSPELQAARAAAAEGRPLHVVVQQGGTWSRWGNRIAWIAVGICVLIIISLFTSYSEYMQTNPKIYERYHSLSATGSDKVAIITIDGTIMHSDGFEKWQIDRVREDDEVKAIVLRVDSPGGTVTGSHYLYHHLTKLRKEKNIPLVVSMGGIAASGGYYVSMAVGETPNSIFAEPTTWTGSIGVIIPHYDLSGLLDRIDVKDDSIASHRLKGMLSPTRPMTEEERALAQELVDSSLEDFVAIVKSGRPNLTDEQIKESATGQVFTAKQAKKRGLVDQLDFVEAAIDRAIELAELDRDNVRVVKYAQPKGIFDDVLGSPLGKSSELSALMELSTPRAYYLFTLVPALVESHR